jgi:hypothetical protein
MIQLTTSNIVFVLGLLGTIFTVYNYFRNPQIGLDKKQALDEKDRIRKDDLIEQKIKWEREVNDQKFCDFGNRLDKAMELAQNHTHTVDVKVDKLIEVVSVMGKDLIKLGTIIEERIPNKK